MDKVNKIAGSCVLMVKVYSYDGKNIKGILYDVSGNLRYSYSNMTQLILRINEILNTSDEADVTKLDIFESARREGKFDLIESSKPWIFDKQRVFATFRLQIYFRKFDTWQGIIACTDSGNSNAFRSVLEMTLMMDSELEAAAASSEDADVIK